MSSCHHQVRIAILSRTIRAKIFLSLLLLLFSLNSYGNPVAYQPLNTLKVVAKAFIEKNSVQYPKEQVNIKIGHLDNRLRLKQCQSPLQAFSPYKTGNAVVSNLVGVRCNNPIWSIFIPVQIEVIVPVVVARQHLPRGTRLSLHDIQLIPQNILRLHRGFLKDPEALVGMQILRTVRAGTVLYPQQLKRPYMVKKGQNITISIHSKAIHIRTKGTALQNGWQGERIKIKNSKTQRIVEAIVRNPNEAYIPL